MFFPSERICRTESDTENLANEFANSLKGGEVVILNGNLGAGKTFFIKSVCSVMGIHNVVSPTFAIVNEHNGKFHINHFDFYRINSINELYDIGFDDYLNNNSSITFIEWGELFRDILPKKRIEINIEFDNNLSRVFKLVIYE
ncbi:MAG: tRNA (adenosine(37)-N6)-threonylcarbamoyltransferase complex ATPase subunit type 1 TsaE [Ignavibacterium sp.]|nr:tRNA (adenosine(37)-N6)-threonylcarbamoyltransferase complex ATPase subunit type 1 TsaE [Ignavibacterium sp.]